MAIAESMLALNIASSLGGGVFSALGGSADRKLANQQADLMMEQANMTLLAGDFQKRQIRYVGRKAIGGHVASAGAGGVAIAGSVVDRAADIQGQVDQDLLTTEFNAAQQARQLRTQAGIVRAQGARAELAGQVGGMFSALSGLTRGLSYYYGYDRAPSDGLGDVLAYGPVPNFGIRR